MRRGLVLPFPVPQRLTADDLASLGRIAALTGVRIERCVGRHRREAAILAVDGRQLWIERDGPGLLARTACSGQLLARGADVDELLAAVRVARFAASEAVRLSTAPHSAQSHGVRSDLPAVGE